MSHYVIYSSKRSAWIQDLDEHGFSGTKKLQSATMFSKLSATALAKDLNDADDFVGEDWKARKVYLAMEFESGNVYYYPPARSKSSKTEKEKSA
jgi:hypothetical protein